MRRGGYVDPALKKRTFAFFLDFATITFLFKGILYAYSNFLIEITDISIEIQNEMLTDMYLIEFPIFTIIFCSYFALSYYMSDGKTPGKVLFNLKITTNDKTRLGLRHCILRSFGYYLCYLPMAMLFIIPYLRSDKRGIPDWLSGTSVSYSSKKQDNKNKEEQSDISKTEHLSSTG